MQIGLQRVRLRERCEGKIGAALCENFGRIGRKAESGACWAFQTGDLCDIMILD
jgi:hypothetical protein